MKSYKRVFLLSILVGRLFIIGGGRAFMLWDGSKIIKIVTRVVLNNTNEKLLFSILQVTFSHLACFSEEQGLLT